MPNLNLTYPTDQNLRPKDISEWLGLITSTIGDLKGENWYNFTTFTLKQLTQAINNDPNFATTMNNALATKLNASAYTATDVLNKLKTVDGSGSGLDADTVRGYVPVNKAGDTMTGFLTLYGDPTQALHAATKQYVDTLMQTFSVKTAVRAATTANITLSGTQTIDGVALVVGDRVLVKNQTDAKQNGIYVVQSGAWVRANDADTDPKLTNGLIVFVKEGNENGNRGWILTTDNPITVGATPLNFEQFSGAGQITAGAGLTKSGDTLSLANSGVTTGTYTKVTVDVYGRVTSGTTLSASDIPALDWSKITTGKPTTLAGYGITDSVNVSEVVTAPAPNKILKLDGNSKLPASITGNADGNAATASKLQTARTISLSGDTTGSVSFDGSANVTIATTLTNSGVTAGTYTKVTVDAKGRVTSGSTLLASDIPSLDWSKITTGKPTTLSGYGITDAVPIKTVSATTPTTSGWYRIATSPINIGPNDALFTVEWFGGVEKGRAIFYARCTDGIPKTTEIQQAAYSSITNNDITKARIVYNTTATGNYAYVEIFKPSSQALTVNVTITNPTGWSTVSPNTTGSIPSGYTSIETTFGGAINASKDIITTAKLVGQQLESIASSGTPPLIIASTTKVNNLNVDMVDDYHVNTGTTANTIPIRDGSGNLPGNITGNAATATKLQTARTISISGDVSANGISFDGSGDVALSATLVNTGVAPGTYTKVTVDSKGRVTSGSTLLASDIPSLDWSKITTGKPTTLAGYGITDGVNISEVVTSPTPNKILRLDANSKLPASITGNADGNAATASKLQTSRTISLSGDVSGSVSFDGSSNVTISSTLANTGVVSGTYTKVTVDSKGRVTSATTLAASDIPNLDWSKITTGKPTTLAGYGITDAAHATHNHDSVYLKLSGGTMTGPLTLSGDPTQALHAATKQYVDGLIQGLRRRTSIRAATTGNITLSGIQSIDGVTLSVGDRVLVKNQTNPVENGIYIVQSGTWTRATDFDDSTDLDGSVFVFVEQGTTQAETGWVLASDDSVVIGRDPISWVQFSSAGIVNGDAITIVKSGNILSLKSGVVSAGTYPKVTVDTYGRVTAGSPLAASDIPNLDWSKITTGKPTTLAGYGITDAVNISEVVSSPTANKILRLDSNGKLPASITGDAASVGGFSQDRILVDRGSDTNDWNTITTQGVYRVGRTDWTGVNGAPTNAYSFGTLVVVQNGNSVSQIYYPHNTVGKGVFTRTKWNASDWGPWEKYWTDRNMGPGSGLDADTVDGKNLSQLIQNDVNDQTIQGRGSLVRLSILNSTDTGETELVVAGNPANGQGTGRVYVGQDPTLYGGGIEYNGDANPAGSGAGTDYFALFRVDNGNKYWTARNFYSNNDWEFRGWVTAPNIKATATTGGLVVGDGTTGEIKVGSTTLTGQGDSTLRVTTSANGYVEIGPKSTEYAHFNTDRQYYYFNKNILVMGYRALTTNDTGSGKGLDSDTTDGLHATSFVRSDAIDDVDYRLNFNNNLAEKAPYQAGPVTLWKHRNLASYTSTSPSDAGAFVIECPFGFISTMMKVTIEGYFYDSTGPFKTEVGFYPYSSNKTFHNYGFVNYGKKNLRVRLARKISTGNVVIILGDEASSYSYPQLHVTDFIQGYSATGSNLGDGWKIYKETNLTGYDTIVDVPDQTDVAYAQNANMLDGIDSTGFLRRNVDTDTTGKITITRDGDAIVLNKDTTTSYSGITFNSKCNPGSDYAYIRYYDDVSNFLAAYDSGRTNENSAIVIGIENDENNSNNDYLVLRGAAKVIVDANGDTSSFVEPERVIEFRKEGTLVSYIDNTGKYMGDADTLDGLHASSFMRADQPNTSTIGNLSVGGSLTVTGSTTLISGLTIAGGNDLSIGATGADDTGDIIFKNSSGNEKVRLYTENTGNVLFISTSSSPTTTHFAFDSGKLGIGTTSFEPNIKLQVLGGGIVAEESGSTYGMGLLATANASGLIFRKDGLRHAGLKWDGSKLYLLDASANGIDPDWVVGTPVATYDIVNSRVGIGTASPARRFHVVDTTWDNTTGGGAIIENSSNIGAGITLKPTASSKPNGWALYAGATNATIGDGSVGFWNHTTNTAPFMINQSGNVGIGTTSPSYRLDVNGDTRISGVVRFGKMTYQVTFSPGETTKTITHNLGTTNYMCTLGANSVARHVAWANKAANTIDIVIDDAYPFGSITVDVILMAY